MNAAGGSRDVIGEGIETLQRRYGPFPVNQTTLSLSGEAYRDAARRADEGVADVYVRVRNDDGDVLHVERGDRSGVPRCVGEGERSLAERAHDAVREATGIEPALDEVTRVTIAGVRNAENVDADTVYRLLVLFEATREGGELEAGTWRSEAAVPEFV